MNANAIPLLAIFGAKMRLEVPLFQRQYVWGRDQQWDPLWEDIERKFREYLEGRNDAPVHFLGAMVLDQKQTPTTHVEKRQVIDGQQRLTTIQVFLAAFRDVCRESQCTDLADECESFTLNRGMMANPEADRFKVWPTQLDRQQFADVILSGSRSALEEKHPLVKRKYAHKPMPRPRMVEAYLFFHDRLSEFFLGSVEEPPLAADAPLSARMEECFQALKNSFKVVVIDLDHDDDAQVIFETLNARGEPLLPADLLRNYIFLRAARRGEESEELYNRYWKNFDDPFWREEVRQGRLSRPRSDLYMQHFLTGRLGTDIPVKHLFVEYKNWIERRQPFSTVGEELATLARQGDHFRRIIAPQKDDVLYSLVTFLDLFDIRSAYPLLLWFLNAGLDESEWRQVSRILESYLLRRAICGMHTKNYTRVFLTLTRGLQAGSSYAEHIARHLSSLTSSSGEWPKDENFQNAWETGHIFQRLQSPKIVHIFRRLNETYLTAKSESISIVGQLTIEHILPQNWLDHWPLADGSRGLTPQEMSSASEDDLRAAATRRRSLALHTLGNLTIMTQPLNSATSNNCWHLKKTALLDSSLLPLNQQLRDVEQWDEEAIQRRAKELFRRALQIWPAPPAIS